MHARYACSCCGTASSFVPLAAIPPPFLRLSFPFLPFPSLPPTSPVPFSTVARPIIRPGNSFTSRSPGCRLLSAKPRRIGVPQKGQIELTGYKLDISSAAFRIKCLFRCSHVNEPFVRLAKEKRPPIERLHGS